MVVDGVTPSWAQHWDQSSFTCPSLTGVRRVGMASARLDLRKNISTERAISGGATIPRDLWMWHLGTGLVVALAGLG